MECRICKYFGSCLPALLNSLLSLPTTSGKNNTRTIFYWNPFQLYSILLFVHSEWKTSEIKNKFAFEVQLERSSKRVIGEGARGRRRRHVNQDKFSRHIKADGAPIWFHPLIAEFGLSYFRIAWLSGTLVVLVDISSIIRYISEMLTGNLLLTYLINHIRYFFDIFIYKLCST